MGPGCSFGSLHAGSQTIVSAPMPPALFGCTPSCRQPYTSPSSMAQGGSDGMVCKPGLIVACVSQTSWYFMLPTARHACILIGAEPAATPVTVHASIEPAGSPPCD